MQRISDKPGQNYYLFDNQDGSIQIYKVERCNPGTAGRSRYPEVRPEEGQPWRERLSAEENTLSVILPVFSVLSRRT